MKKLRLLCTLFLLVPLLISCTLETEPEVAEDSEYIRIDADEAKEMMENEDVIIVDVRTEAEFEEQHIEGAILIPDYEIEDLAEEKLPDKEATILVYCRTGRRSENASRALIEMGYTSVYDFGGIVDWDYKTTSGE